MRNSTLFITSLPARRIASSNARTSHQDTSASAAHVRDALIKTVVKTHQTPTLSAIQVEEMRLRATLTRKMIAQTEGISTERLTEGSPDVLSILKGLPSSGLRVGEAATYTRLPAPRHVTDMMVDTPCWRIELHGLGLGIGPIGIDVAGDVVIGRGPEADFDLDPYRGYERAVSRRHAMLRPTKHQLHLIDLSSTNGTLYNAVPLGRSNTCALKHDDVITLGLLTITIKIIDGPELSGVDAKA